MQGRNLLSEKREWWVMLEDKLGELYDLHHIDNPFIGTEKQVEAYADQLAEGAIKKGFPLKEISLIPIRRAL